MTRGRLLSVAAMALAAILATAACEQNEVNIAEQTGLADTTLIAIADGSSHKLRLMITDHQVISGIVDALDTDLSVTPKLFCGPDYEIM